MTDDTTRLDALRQLQQLDPGDGYTRLAIYIWKAADKAKLTIRRAQA